MRCAFGCGLLVTAIVLLTACGSKKEAGADTATKPEDKVLFVYNWSDYIGETTIADFEARTGIKVTYDVFDSNEVLETKLLAGNTGYDIVVPSSTFLQRQIQAGVFRKLDKPKLPHLANMNLEIMKLVAEQDPGNEHSIIYMWGTTGIGYNRELVKKALGTDTIDGWEAVFDPAIAQKLAQCGISMLDSATDVVESALIYLGRDPNSEDRADLAAAEELLTKVRPYVRYFHSSQYINDLATGEICVSLGWSGDIIQARDRAAEAKALLDIAYAIPKQGAMLWFDMMAIPADAPNPDHAHAFLNFLMEPEVIAGVSNYVAFANANAAALQFVDDEVKNDPSIYPTSEVMKNLHPDIVESQEFSRDLNRAWTRIRTGQ
ncbi:MAG: polyamine ABC transporter substrate-binding protein [Gammaproteobacteria bacterium]|nr:polyamine ABC transporter substrate-binding protein [Gammaproteobacteria bacterium]